MPSWRTREATCSSLRPRVVRHPAASARIRAVAPDAGIRSNVIVGFPGETEQDLAELEAFLTEARLDAVGVFGYSFLEENMDKLKGAIVDGVTPTYETIASGKYPASRPLFIYVKKAHVNVIPGINEFIAEYTSEKALGEEGYLSEKGLIPPLKNEIAKIREDAKALKPIKL